MQNEQLKTILYEYANTKGLGLPLTAEQCLNAMSSWLVDTLPECIDVKVVTLATGEEPYVTLTGNGTPDDHYIFTFGLPAGIQGDKGEEGEDGQAYVGFYNGTMIPVTGQYYDYTTYSAYITWTNNSAPEVGSPFIIQWIQNTNDTTYMVVGYRADTQMGVSGDWLYVDGASIIDGKSICLGTVSSDIYPDEGQYITDDIKWITTKPVTNDSFWLMYSYTSSSGTSYYTFAVLGTYDGVYYKINSLSNIQGATGATGATGVQGIEGLSIYDVADEVTAWGNSILITAFTVPSGYSVKVGDLCLGTDGIVGQVESLTSTTATVRYVLALDNEKSTITYKINSSDYRYIKLFEIQIGVPMSFSIYFNGRSCIVTISSTGELKYYYVFSSNFLYYNISDNICNIYLDTTITPLTAPYYITVTNWFFIKQYATFDGSSVTISGLRVPGYISVNNMNVYYLNDKSGSSYQLISNTPLANSYTYTYYFKLGTSSSSDGCVFTFSLNYGSDMTNSMTSSVTAMDVTGSMLSELGFTDISSSDDYAYLPASGVYYSVTTGLSYQIIGISVSDLGIEIVYVSNDSTSSTGVYTIYNASTETITLVVSDIIIQVNKNTGSTTPTNTYLHFEE